MIMPPIEFPLPYVLTQYPGYYWNIEDERLYSIKRGTLKKLALIPKGNWMKYHISVYGCTMWVCPSEFRIMMKRKKENPDSRQMIEEYDDKKAALFVLNKLVRSFYAS